MKEQRINDRVEPFLHESLREVFRVYQSGQNARREIDFFRGSLVAFFHLNYVPVSKFFFLFNFVCWLENPQSIINEDEVIEYENFFDIFTGDL